VIIRSLVCVAVAPPRLRSRVRWTLVGLVVVMVGLSLAHRTSTSREPATSTELVRVATQFNHDYQFNIDGPVWDRFDPASRALISRANYVRWHQECPASPGHATVRDANALTGGWWVVNYEIGGVSLHDYWHQVEGRWRFSLVRSNPSASVLYASTFAAFARATGCTPS